MLTSSLEKSIERNLKLQLLFEALVKMLVLASLWSTFMARGGAMTDMPIVGSWHLSLNGNDWTASGTTREFSGNCTYEEGVGEQALNCTCASRSIPNKCYLLSLRVGSHSFTFLFLSADYNPGSGIKATPVAYHGSQEQCCQLCGASATCAGAVWSSGNQCEFKTDADMKHKVLLPNSAATK